MKRFFQRLDNSSNYQRDYQRQEGPSSYSSSGSFLGKVFIVGQYHCTVEDVIAEGGFSLVFLVKANNGIRYALKRLYVNNEQDLFICKREIEIARKLGSHKNIVKLVESTINYCGNDVHEIFMLMQYCKGQLLHLMNDKINTGFSEREIIRIICDLCEAIARMHHNDPPIIHRDLKIENILISDDGNYMLCDFGSATSKTISLDSGQSALSIEEEIKRYTTLAYRSPEMVDVYSGKLITTKADIWALGCLLYKLCYYNLPFGESTLAIQNAQLTIPDSYSDRYSQRLSSLIAYMLVPNPDDRPDIYQISSLIFSFTGNECPVLNRNNVKTPSWSDLRPPPTESQAREFKRTIPPTISNDRTQNSHTTTANISSNLYQQNNHLDTDKTTTVTPRQRPKATININSVLTTSPVTFQRSHTPSNNESESNLSVKDTHHNIGLTNSHSFSSGSQLFSKVEPINKNNNRNIGTDWSKADKQSPTFASNPILNNDNKNGNNNSGGGDHGDFITSKTSSSSLNNNPFITTRNNSASGKEKDLNDKNTSVPTPPPRNQSLTLLENASNVTTHQQHRRNMSDSFSIKSTDKISQNVNKSNIGILRMKSNDQSVSKESSHSDNHSVVRSLNPFEDSNDYSYEDQLFGKEFDKIRSENQRAVDNDDYNPFEDAPFNQERLKRYLENKQKSSNQKIVITTSDNDSNESIVIKTDNNNKIDNDGKTAETGSTSLGEKIDFEHHLTSNKSGNKSISSSSQGGIATSPTANYMPLYSSDTAEDDDFDDGHRSKRQLRTRQINDNIDIDNVVAVGVTSGIVNNNENLRSSHHIPHPRFNDITMTGDMTKPLVEDDDDDDDDDLDDHNSDVDDDVLENDEHLSIGSASDLQNTDTDDEDDSQDENDSSSDSIEPNEKNNDYSDNNEDDDDSENDVISFKYGRVKNQSSPLLDPALKKTLNKPLLNISKIHVRLNDNTNNNDNKMDTINVNNNDDTTSVSNSSIRSDSQKNIDSLDHLIGHVEGHRPLLEDEEDDDITTTVPAPVLPTSKSLISIEPEQTILIFDDDNKDKSNKFYQCQTDKFPRTSYSSGNLHSDFDSATINQQQIYETEENRRLDEEVERSLIPQVIYDQMNNKDLFGSIPFTNKELINHTIQLQNETVTGQEISNSATDNENRFENSFTDLPVPIIQESTTSPSKTDSLFVNNSIKTKEQMKATDLFGAVPFSSSHSHISTNDSKCQNLITIPQPLSSSSSKLQTVKTGVIKIKVSSTPSSSSISPSTASTSIINSTTTLTSGVIASTGTVTTTFLAKHQPQTVKYVQSQNLSSINTILTTANISTTTSTLSLATTNAGISKLSRNQLQRSNLKIKSKVAKKYEVDESDDEVDGLLDPLENDDIDNDVVQFDSSNKKKNKKDKKEKPDKKSKETKIKEKKEDKKLKNKEKADKADKSKTKDQIKEEKKREKENKKKEKDKKEKELKDKKKDRKSSETSNIGQSESQPIVGNENDKLDTGNRSLIKDGKLKKGSINSETSTSNVVAISGSSNSTKKISTKQAFANMSFEDEIQHHHGISSSNTTNSVTITRC